MTLKCNCFALFKFVFEKIFLLQRTTENDIFVLETSQIRRPLSILLSLVLYVFAHAQSTYCPRNLKTVCPNTCQMLPRFRRHLYIFIYVIKIVLCNCGSTITALFQLCTNNEITDSFHNSKR